MTRRQDNIVANGALSAVDHDDPTSVTAGTLPPQPATAEDKDNSDSIAMDLGESASETPPKRNRGRIPGTQLYPWVCTAEYMQNMGGNKRSREYRMQPSKVWSPKDEIEDDESDLQVPDNWNYKPYWEP